MSQEKTLYEVLEISSHDDLASSQIKTHLKLLRVNAHPQKTGDEQAFTAILEAIEILNDPDQRAEYDRNLKNGHGHQTALEKARKIRDQQKSTEYEQDLQKEKEEEKGGKVKKSEEKDPFNEADKILTPIDREKLLARSYIPKTDKNQSGLTPEERTSFVLALLGTTDSIALLKILNRRMPEGKSEPRDPIEYAELLHSLGAKSAESWGAKFSQLVSLQIRRYKESPNYGKLVNLIKLVERDLSHLDLNVKILMGDKDEERCSRLQMIIKILRKSQLIHVDRSTNFSFDETQILLVDYVLHKDTLFAEELGGQQFLNNCINKLSEKDLIDTRNFCELSPIEQNCFAIRLSLTHFDERLMLINRQASLSKGVENLNQLASCLKLLSFDRETEDRHAYKDVIMLKHADKNIYPCRYTELAERQRLQYLVKIIAYPPYEQLFLLSELQQKDNLGLNELFTLFAEKRFFLTRHFRHLATTRLEKNLALVQKTSTLLQRNFSSISDDDERLQFLRGMMFLPAIELANYLRTQALYLPAIKQTLIEKSSDFTGVFFENYKKALQAVHDSIEQESRVAKSEVKSTRPDAKKDSTHKPSLASASTTKVPEIKNMTGEMAYFIASYLKEYNRATFKNVKSTMKDWIHNYFNGKMPELSMDVIRAHKGDRTKAILKEMATTKTKINQQDRVLQFAAYYYEDYTHCTFRWSNIKDRIDAHLEATGTLSEDEFNKHQGERTVAIVKKMSPT